MITGTLLVDLRDVDPDRARHRFGQLHLAPDGARVIVIVGALAVNGTVVSYLHEPELHRATTPVQRLDFEIQGEPHAVRRWVEAVRFGGVLPGVLT